MRGARPHRVCASVLIAPSEVLLLLRFSRMASVRLFFLDPVLDRTNFHVTLGFATAIRPHRPIGPPLACVSTLFILHFSDLTPYASFFPS